MNQVEQDKKALRKLIRMLKAEGFKIPSLWDGESRVSLKGENRIINEVFNLDESWLRIKKDGFKTSHTLYLIPNNGDSCDMFTDWSYTEGDSDGFDSLMNRFMDELED